MHPVWEKPRSGLLAWEELLAADEHGLLAWCCELCGGTALPMAVYKYWVTSLSSKDVVGLW